MTTVNVRWSATWKLPSPSSGPSSSAGRPMPDGRRLAPGGWNRIHLIVEDLSAEVDRLRAAGVLCTCRITELRYGTQAGKDARRVHPIPRVPIATS
jgi:hypothetical protein